MKPRLFAHRRQHGFTLIEGLIAILVFSLGVLALIALQVASVQQTTNAKFRSEASLLAEQLLGQMWVSDRTALSTNFASTATAYTTWLANVQATLPGSTANAPTVTFGADGLVTITIFWQAPNEPAGDPAHQYLTVAQLK